MHVTHNEKIPPATRYIETPRIPTTSINTVYRFYKHVIVFFEGFMCLQYVPSKKLETLNVLIYMPDFLQ